MHPASIANTLRAATSTYSNVTVGLLGTLVTLSLLGQISSIYYFLALTPGNVIPPLVHIQTLFTAGFLETNWVLLAVDVVALSFAGGVFEPLWGVTKYLEFVVVVNVFGCLAIAVTYIFAYVVLRDTQILFLQCHGFTCALAGFAVAYKQTNPQKKLTIPHVGFSVDARLAPALFTTGTVVLYLLGAVRSHVPVMAVEGVVVAWVYLRYFQTRENVRGDPSDNFAFADLFPAKMQPTVSVVGGRVYSVADSLKLVPKPGPQQGLPQTVNQARPTATSLDAERRKQTALRDLEKRMGTQSGDVAVAVDTEEDSSDTNVAAQRNSTQASGTLSGTDTESE